VRRLILICALLASVNVPASVLPVQSQLDPYEPRFTAAGELLFPENYREWVWLSSGLGMAYGPSVRENPNPVFDNVFVTPRAYRSFLETGTWPDKTMFVLELRSSATEGSINKQGRFQGRLLDVEVELKDEKRFPSGWAFFAFGASGAGRASKPIPASAECYSCHAQHGAVDNTFVQFYPTLADVARKKGTFRER